MFGRHEIPVRITDDALFLSAETTQGTTRYSRRCNDEHVERTIVFKGKHIDIYPVEPTNTPKPITSLLFIEFDHPLIIEPQGKTKVFLKFPVEIGVFLKQGKKNKMIDVFCIGKQKLILYGRPDEGVICRYWKSPCCQDIPETAPYMEGVVELTVKNKGLNWTEISRTVFNAFGMKIFYNNDLVSMKGTMTIENGSGETDFEDSPIMKHMDRSLEVYRPSKLSMSSLKYQMEYGL